MNQYVIDASVAVEYLLKTALGLAAANIIEQASALHAPEFIDVEVMSVLRRLVNRDEVSEDRALLALDDLVWWPIERIPTRALVRHGWRHRQNVSAYDAIYVAAARALEIPLLTTDSRLSRAPNLDITIQTIRRA